MATNMNMMPNAGIRKKKKKNAKKKPAQSIAPTNALNQAY